MFAIVDDDATIHILRRAEYEPRNLAFDQAIEAYPILVMEGRAAYPEPPHPPGARARRTIVAIDEEDHVLIIVSAQGVFSLREIALWLPQAGLNIDTALNLDGGRSTGMALRTNVMDLHIPSYVDLPMVLAIYSR